MGSTKYIGQRVTRREDPRFLTGRTRFVDDIRLPAMAACAFVRSPHAHAEITALRVEDAAKRAGTLAILTGAESARRAGPIRGELIVPEWSKSDFPVLAWPRVRFVGEAVAAVAATDRARAEDAAEAVEVEYAPLPVVSDAERAVAAGSPLIRPEWGGNVYIERAMTAGDVAAAFAQADVVLERTYRMQRHTGMPLEGRACLADYNPARRALTFYTATQIPHNIRTELAGILGLAENDVRVISPDVGGGFGIKAHLFPEEVAVCLLAMRLGRPVKWIEDTREHLLASLHAHEHVHRVKLAARRDGTILGIELDVLVDCGAYSCWPESAAAEAAHVLRVLPGPYRLPAYRARSRSVATNKCPIGTYRGVGRPPAVFTMERLLDDLARVLAVDPVELRLRNSLEDTEFPYTTITGLVYDSGSPVASLRKAVEAIGYDGFRARQAEARAEGRYLGIGFAAFFEQTAHTTAEFVKRGQKIVRGYDSVSVSLDPSGKVTVDSSLHSHGQGHETSFAQVVAERLGVPLDDVRVRFGDTNSAPYGMGTSASRSAVLGGGAAWKAADNVRQALLKVAASLMEADAGDLDIVDGVIRVKGSPQGEMAVAEVARIAYHRSERLPAGVMPADLTSLQSYGAPPGQGTFSNSVHAVEVEVDAGTGFLKILRYVVVEDCGVVINPLIVEGQVHGGVAQGIGGALLEHLVYDAEGQMLSQTLADYLLPTALDVPGIEVHHLTTPSPFTIGGFKGMGEGGAVAPYGALGNAVSDALAPFGVSVDTLPLTPERILWLIRDGRTTDGGPSPAPPLA